MKRAMYMILINPFVEVVQGVLELVLGFSAFCITTSLVFVVLSIPFIICSTLFEEPMIFALAGVPIAIMAIAVGMRAGHWAANGGPIEIVQIRGRQKSKVKKEGK